MFAVITAWSAWQDNPKSKAGMKKDAQAAGFLAEYLKTLAAWAHSFQQWVRKNRNKADPPKTPWLLSPAPEDYFKPGEYARLAAVEINVAEKGQPEAKYKVMLCTTTTTATTTTTTTAAVVAAAAAALVLVAVEVDASAGLPIRLC